MADPGARPARTFTRAHLVADRLRDRLNSGEFAPGQPLPSIEKLADEHEVAKNTVVAAIKILSEEGRVHSVSGSGVYVLDPADEALAEELADKGDGLFQQLMAKFDVMQDRLDALEARQREDREEIRRLKESTTADSAGRGDH
jgi:DNA-binding GntR family transcriptional regulator